MNYQTTNQIESDFNHLTDDIKLHFQLKHQFPNGFYYTKCPICQKGDAGFYFDDEKVIFNCFKAKCSYSAQLTKGQYVSKRFRHLMEVSNIQIPPSLLFSSKQQNKIEEALDPQLYQQVYYENIEVPEHFRPIQKHQSFFINYLSQRLIDFDELPHEIYTSSKGKWKNRIIFPLYFNYNLIGFVGKKIDDSTPGQRYETESFQKNKSLFYAPNGYIPDPVFVVEGVFDALSIPNAIAMLGSNISKGVAYLLKNKSEVIIVPDRDNLNVIKDMKKYHINVSTPFYDAKDVNEAIIKYGRISTTKMILDHICYNQYEAEINMKMWNQ